MNLLAHQYLSFQNHDLQIGNLYGEIVRAKDYLQYPFGIQNGILLHRSIDTFTDSHEIVKKSTQIFHENYGKYSPIIVDVLYDYFLIKNWNHFSTIEFETFVKECYLLFKQNLKTFPDSLQFIVNHLLKHDWFHNYENVEGIRQTLYGISQRSKFKNNIDQSITEFLENESSLEKDFMEYFPDLINHCKDFLHQLNK